MRRILVVLLLLTALGTAGALVHAAWTTEREYQRLVAAGDRALGAGQPFQALEAYSGAIALKPESMLAHLKRGRTYQERGELDQALRDLRRAADLDPTATRPLELLGDVNMSLDRHERAADSYRAYLDIDDRSSRVFYKLGLALYRAQQPLAAAGALAEAIAHDRTMAEAHYLMGLCRRELGELDAARDALEQATRLAPALVEAREALAAVYTATGDAARAADQLEALAVLDPSRPERLIALGEAHARAGRHEAAVLTLGRASERFPDIPQVYAALGRVWLAAAESRNDEVALKKAIEALTIAARHSDAAGDTLTALGRAYLRAGDASAAERALRQAVARLPAPAEAHRQLAQLFASHGAHQDARDALVRYATLVGDAQPLAGVATEIAELSLRLGQPHHAVRWLDRAVDEAGPTPALLARLADATWQAGDATRARAIVDEGLALDPANRALVQLRRRLP